MVAQSIRFTLLALMSLNEIFTTDRNGLATDTILLNNARIHVYILERSTSCQINRTHAVERGTEISSIMWIALPIVETLTTLTLRPFIFSNETLRQQETATMNPVLMANAANAGLVQNLITHYEAMQKMRSDDLKRRFKLKATRDGIDNVAAHPHFHVTVTPLLIPLAM